jgi:Protein of Unknown function (DUF2784).
MIYGVLATFVASIHLLFVVFVVLGGLAVLRWPWVMWVHLPAAAWGALIELAGWICPLTPLENWLRRKAGGEGYSGGFLDHYIFAALYPEGLSRTTQTILGIAVIVINAVAYWRIFTRK